MATCHSACKIGKDIEETVPGSEIWHSANHRRHAYMHCMYNTIATSIEIVKILPTKLYKHAVMLSFVVSRGWIEWEWGRTRGNEMNAVPVRKLQPPLAGMESLFKFTGLNPAKCKIFSVKRFLVTVSSKQHFYLTTASTGSLNAMSQLNPLYSFPLSYHSH